MRNSGLWQPSKYERRNGRLRATRDQKELMVTSRVIADLIASYYDAYIPKYCSGYLADLGCGKAPLYGTYKIYIDYNICIDWPKSLHDNEYLDCVTDLTQGLPLKSGIVDTIILSDVMEHIPTPDYLWREMFRVLSSKGKLLMNVPFYYGVHEMPHDYYRYTEFALRRSARLAGFEIIHLEAVGGIPEILADLLSKSISVVPLMGKPFAGMIQFLAITLRRTALGRRISQKSSQHFPFGYFLVAVKNNAGATWA